MPKEKSCGTIVYRKTNNQVKFLLLHYSEGHWEFPKGHVESKESEKETALRELREETGILDANIMNDFRHHINYFFRRGEKIISKEVVFFLCETKTKDIVLSNEHIGFEWLTFENAIAKLKFKSSQEVLTAADEFVKLS